MFVLNEACETNERRDIFNVVNTNFPNAQDRLVAVFMIFLSFFTRNQKMSKVFEDYGKFMLDMRIGFIGGRCHDGRCVQHVVSFNDFCNLMSLL